MITALPRITPAGPAIAGSAPKLSRESSDAHETPAGIELQGVTVQFGNRRVLDDISLCIPRGSSTIILGANEAGKSTLLKVMATVLKPSAGCITLGNAGAAGNPRASIGYAGHSLMLYEELTPLENLLFFGRLHRVPECEAAALELLAALGVQGRARQPVASLSCGIARRVALARALLHRPRYLLIDEPLAGLDSAASELVVRQLDAARRRGATVVTTGHGPGPGLEAADRAVVLGGGRVVLDAACDATTPERVRRAVWPEGGGAA